MANPNIVNTASVTGTTSVQEVTTSATPIVENTASSGQLHKINSLLLANYKESDTTQGFSLENASYDNVSFNTSSQDAFPKGFIFDNDGTKLFLMGRDTDQVYQYSLSTAFDLSTISYDSISFDVSQDNGTTSVTLSSDGTKMYVIGASSDNVYQYTLSNPFDLSTASYDNVSLSIGSRDDFASDLKFNIDGTKMFLVGALTNTIYQYTLTNGFDISTASYDNVSFDFSSEGNGITFNNGGTKIYVITSASSSVYQYSLPTAFDITNISYDNISFDVSSEETDPRAIAFNNNGTKMYISGKDSDSIHQYTTESVVTTSGGGPTPVTVDVYRDGTPYHVAKDVVVPTYATVAAITKDTGIYLEEGDSLRCTAGENAAIHGICSYEIISEST